MGTSIQKSKFFRRGLTAFAGLAMVAGGLVGISSSANAAVTSGSLEPETWVANSSPQATVTENFTTSQAAPFVIVEWDWATNGWPAPSTSETPTLSGSTYICPSGITFTAVDATWSGGSITCRYSSAGPNTSVSRNVSLTGATATATGSTGSVVVVFPSGLVTALPSASNVGRWTIPNSVQVTARVVTSVPVNFYTLDLDPNGGTCQTSKIQGYATTWANAPGSQDCTRPGYTFTGYNTSPNGTGTAIDPGGNVNFTGDNRVYAQWFDGKSAVVPAGAPTKVVATSKWNRVQVNWQAPVDRGTLPITNYMVKATPGGQTCVTRLLDRKFTQCSFNTLVPGTQYTFTAQALTGAGWGTSSASSNSASPYNLQITKSGRNKVFFGLAGTKVKLVVITPGYASGVQVTPSVSYDGAKKWSKFSGNSFRTKAAIANKHLSLKIARGSNSTTISVKFVDADGNESNVVKVAPAR